MAENIDARLLAAQLREQQRSYSVIGKTVEEETTEVQPDQWGERLAALKQKARQIALKKARQTATSAARKIANKAALQAARAAVMAIVSWIVSAISAMIGFFGSWVGLIVLAIIVFIAAVVWAAEEICGICFKIAELIF
ncbi:hypothetical protein D6821_00700 [Candidatus Parcubacteria bacterium]|nr:MAG: hypothetical protein D6821_00700 [Candidatus Parcubacteria bacterium]